MAIKKGKKGKGRRQKSEFDQQLLDLARVTRVVKGGRRFRFRATMVIGNRKGKVGVGVSKGTDVSQAIQKAVADAKKKMITVNLDGNTIAHDLKQKLGSARVLLRPAAEGRGIIAGGAVRTVVELAGVKDVVAKSYGTSNKLNVARCTIEALTHLRAVEQSENEDTSKKDDKKSQKKVAKKSDKKEEKVKTTTAKKDEVKKVATKKTTEKKIVTEKTPTKKVAKEDEPKKTTK
jgi:small subunit ribosomal protein S5